MSGRIRVVRRLAGTVEALSALAGRLGGHVSDVTVIGWLELGRPVAVLELEREQLGSELARTVRSTLEGMDLPRKGAETLRTAIYTDPPVTGWQLSIDGGATWHDGTATGDTEPIIVEAVTLDAPVYTFGVFAGPDAGTIAGSIAVAADVAYLLRATGTSPELVIRQAGTIRLVAP